MLTIETMKKCKRYEYKFVIIRKNRTEYEVYNEVNTNWYSFNNIEKAVECFNNCVKQNENFLKNFK